MKLRNILVLMADEFRYDTAGFMGNPLARTPCLDTLARGASVFENAYTPSPVCVPARPSLATGKYPLHIDCQHFGEDLAPGSLTFARWFSDHGYYTVACGKLHHRGPDQMQGWMHRFGGECAVNWPEPYASRSQIGRSAWTGASELKRAGVGTSPLALHDDYSIAGAESFLRMHFGGMYPIPVETPILLFVSLQQPHFLSSPTPRASRNTPIASPSRGIPNPRTTPCSTRAVSTHRPSPRTTSAAPPRSIIRW